MRRLRILFIGDSLVEFLDWQERFPEHEVLNMGLAGETIEGLFSRLPRLISRTAAPDLVFIMSGINNIAMEEADIRGPYGEVLTKLTRAWPGAGIYVNSLPPARLDWLGPDVVASANRTLKALAEDAGAGFVDLHKLFVEAGPEGCLLPDGVHFTDRAGL